MMNVAIFVSGGGTNLNALLEAKARGELAEANLALVLASRSGTKAEERAIAAGIPTLHISRTSFKDQEAFDLALIEALMPYDIGLVVLAGFLTRLGSDFITAYKGRIINVHPSLLPLFGGKGFYGLKPHIAVLEAGHEWTGATVHLVTDKYDEGRILCQKRVAVNRGETPEELQERVMREAEQIILPEVVDLYTRKLIVL